MKDRIEHRRGGRIRSAQNNDDPLRHADNQRRPYQVRRTALEGGCNVVDTHIVQLKDHGNDTGYQTHHKELRRDLRNIKALYHNAPYCPDHGRQDHQQNQLVAQPEICFSLIISLEFFPVSGIAVIGNGQPGILFDLSGIDHSKCHPYPRKHKPEHDTEARAGKHRNLCDPLRDGQAERIHPGSAESDLSCAVCHADSYDSIIPHGNEHGHQDHCKGDCLLAHSKDRASQREQDKQYGDQIFFRALCLFDHGQDPLIHGSCFQHNPEGSADDQDKCHNPHCGTPFIPDSQPLKYIVQDSLSAEILGSEYGGCVGHLFAVLIRHILEALRIQYSPGLLLPVLHISDLFCLILPQRDKQRQNRRK